MGNKPGMIGNNGRKTENVHFQHEQTDNLWGFLLLIWHEKIVFTSLLLPKVICFAVAIVSGFFFFKIWYNAHFTLSEVSSVSQNHNKCFCWHRYVTVCAKMCYYNVFLCLLLVGMSVVPP